MRIYISGQITGLPVSVYQFNFAQAARMVSNLGWEPVNPVELDLDADDCSCELRGMVVGVKGAVQGVKHNWSCYMKRDIREMLKCRGILMLRGWRISPGARMEHHVAISCGLDLYGIVLDPFRIVKL